MIVGIHQPHFLPWLGYFDKIAKSELFVLLDNVQLEKNSYMIRNRILDYRGNIAYLTISANKHGFLEKRYREIKSKDEEIWQAKHRFELERSYGISPYYDECIALIDKIYSCGATTVCNYAITSIKVFMEALDIHTKLILQSDMEIPNDIRKNDLVLYLCKEVGATVYLSGNGASAYNEEETYTQAGIELIYRKFTHPIYPQLHSVEFMPGLSIVDMLFCCGIEKTRQLFWKNVRQTQN